MNDAEFQEPTDAEQELLNASHDLMAACQKRHLRLICSPVPEVTDQEATRVQMYNLIFLAPAVIEPEIKRAIETMLDKIIGAIDSISVIQKH